MGRKSDRVCSICKCTKSYVWRQPVKGKFTCRLCSVCPSTSSKNNSGNQGTRTRSSRGRQLKSKEVNTEKSRRAIFKKNPPQKAPILKAKIATLDNIVHKRRVFQVGDIITTTILNGEKQYGQIQGIIMDAFGEKSTSLIWLQKRIKDCENITHPDELMFDRKEERLRKLDCLEFVVHAPPKYYEKFWELARYTTSKELIEKSVRKRARTMKNEIDIEFSTLKNSSCNDVDNDALKETDNKVIENGISKELTAKNIISNNLTNKLIENGTSEELGNKVINGDMTNETSKTDQIIVEENLGQELKDLEIVTSEEDSMSVDNTTEVIS